MGFCIVSNLGLWMQECIVSDTFIFQKEKRCVKQMIEEVSWGARKESIGILVNAFNDSIASLRLQNQEICN